MHCARSMGNRTRRRFVWTVPIGKRGLIYTTAALATSTEESVYDHLACLKTVMDREGPVSIEPLLSPGLFNPANGEPIGPFDMDVNELLANAREFGGHCLSLRHLRSSTASSRKATPRFACSAGYASLMFSIRRAGRVNSHNNTYTIGRRFSRRRSNRMRLIFRAPEERTPIRHYSMIAPASTKPMSCPPW